MTIVVCAFVGANTMKLNTGKLKKFTASGEVVTVPAGLKRKKIDEGSSKQTKQPLSRPPVRDAVPLVKTVPPVIMVDVDPSLPTNPSSTNDATINQSPHVAMSRAKDAISQLDMGDYSSAHSEDVHYLLIQSLMRVRVFILFCVFGSLCALLIFVSLQGLNEALVMSQRCIANEEDLVALRAKLAADEVEMKNTKWVVAELTRDRKEGLVEVEKVKSELKARDVDVKVVVEARDKVVADLQHLVGQIEGAKGATISEFRAFEAFDDINTRYFLSGFETFRKQVAERFPGLDFSVF